MKTKIFALLILTFTLLTCTEQNETYGSVFCLNEAPVVESISSNVKNLFPGRSFSLGVIMYNRCGYTIQSITINDVEYDMENRTISNQGFTSTIMQDSTQQYLVEIPMVYQMSMGTSFTITDFEYYSWEGDELFPTVYYETINTTYTDEDLLYHDEPTYPTDNTTDVTQLPFGASIYDNSFTIRDLNTGFSENITFDSFFWDGLFEVHIITPEAFLSDPEVYTKDFIRHALNSYSSETAMSTYDSSDIYIVFMNSSFTDDFMNKALEYITADADRIDPSVTIPLDYTFYNGVYTKGILDENGEFVLNEDGSLKLYIKLSEDTEGVWRIDPNSLLGKGVANFNEGIQKFTGWINFNVIPFIEFAGNNTGFLIVSAIVLFVLLFTFSWWFPLATILILQLPSILKVFKIVSDKLAKFFFSQASKGYQRMKKVKVKKS